jgi:hypothetical protein
MMNSEIFSSLTSEVAQNHFSRHKNFSTPQRSEPSHSLPSSDETSVPFYSPEQLALPLVNLQREQPHYLSELTTKNLLDVIKVAKETQSDTVLITDIDETINNSVWKHWNIYKRYIKHLQRVLTKPISNQYSERVHHDYQFLKNLANPTYEQITGAGGTHLAYQNFGQAYRLINKQARSNPNFNSDVPLVTPNLSKYAQAINKKFPFVGALTTRPESVQTISKQELAKDLGLSLPVISRPETTPLEQTTAWKFALLETIALCVHKRVIMLDDQRPLIELIEKSHNQSIRGVLMKGPLTQTTHRSDPIQAVYWKGLSRRLSLMERRSQSIP